MNFYYKTMWSKIKQCLKNNKPMTLCDVQDLNRNTMRKLGATKEEILRSEVRNYNKLIFSSLFFTFKKPLDEDELVNKIKK